MLWGSWICAKCATINTENFTFQMYELEMFNHYHILGKLENTRHTTPPVTEPFSSNGCSIPKSPKYSKNMSQTLHTSTKTSYSGISTNEENVPNLEPGKKSNWRTMVVNCQSLRGKVATCAATIDCIKLDAILGQETWLGVTINTSNPPPPLTTQCIGKPETSMEVECL